MTTQQAIKIIQDYLEYLNDLIDNSLFMDKRGIREALNVVISELEKQPQYPSEEEIRAEAEKSDVFYDKTDRINVHVPRMSEDESEAFIQGALWVLNKWKESK